VCFDPRQVPVFASFRTSNRQFVHSWNAVKPSRFLVMDKSPAGK